jgi:hypothetical protein
MMLQALSLLVSDCKDDALKQNAFYVAVHHTQPLKKSIFTKYVEYQIFLHFLNAT